VEAPQGVQLTGTNRPRTYHKNATRPLCNSGDTTTPAVVASPTPHPSLGHPRERSWRAGESNKRPLVPTVEKQLHNVTAVIAKGKRPVPFRTRKLSPSAPMVLHPPGCGRVGRRRTHIPQKGRNHTRFLPFCAFHPHQHPPTRPRSAPTTALPATRANANTERGKQSTGYSPGPRPAMRGQPAPRPSRRRPGFGPAPGLVPWQDRGQSVDVARRRQIRCGSGITPCQ